MPGRPEGGLLLLQQDMSEPKVRAFGNGRVAVFSGRAPDKTGVNEDAAALIPYDRDSGVLVVADGAGGMRAGFRASNVAIKRLRSTLRAGAREGAPLREMLLEGIDRANAAVCAIGGAATTLAAVEIQHRTVRTYHAGDTPVMVVGGRGLIKLKTIDHSPVGYAHESGVLNEEEAIHHELRHVISNFLGNQDMRVEVSSPLTLAVRDRLLIASDGLFDNLKLREIGEIIYKGRVINAARNLVTLSRQRMQAAGDGEPSKPDDLTLLLYRPIRRR